MPREIAVAVPEELALLTRSLKALLSAAGIVAMTALAGCGSTGHRAAPVAVAASPSATASVVLTTLLSFEPRMLTVKSGTTVTWRVSDVIDHTVTTGSFTLGGDGLRTTERPDATIDLPLTHSRPVSYTFTRPGTYRYYCSIHKGMTGEVDVTP